MSDIFIYFVDWLRNPTSFLNIMAVFVVFYQALYLFRRTLRDITIGYRIAVIGLPRAGKTALIGSIFNRIFHAAPGDRFSPVGQETIHRVNRIIASLDSRKPLPPTKETDVFVFRFIYKGLGNFFQRQIRYEGEVVDFPGELSQRMLESAEDGSLADDIGIFHKEFFSWVISSRVHIFVIDVAQFLLADSRQLFVAQMTAEMRAAWQLLNEEINQSIRPTQRKVALVFAKSDLLEICESLYLTTDEKKSVRSLGYDSPPEMRKKPSNRTQSLSENEQMMSLDFDDLR